MHPDMEDIIIALKSAKNKPNQPYSFDKRSAFNDSLVALRLFLCLLTQNLHLDTKDSIVILSGLFMTSKSSLNGSILTDVSYEAK